MIGTNKNAGVQPGADTIEHFKPNYTRSESYPAELHRILHLVADSAIDADDAYSRRDAAGLGRAISALTLNAGLAKSLSDAWRATQ